MSSIRDIGTSNCYWSNEGQQPYISDVYREYLMDGTRYQNQPWQTQYPLIFRMFFSDDNVKYIQQEILKAGFNAAPDRGQLQGFMNEIYTNDMPYGAYNRLDPNRNNRTVGYAKYYVQRLNAQLLSRVLRNMAVMRHSQRQYLKDISSPQGVLEINRPVYAHCKRNDIINPASTHRLPEPFDASKY